MLTSIKSLYMHSEVCVRVNSTTTKPFEVTAGLRPGCSLSPILLLIYMDKIVKKSESCGRVKIGDCTVQRLIFADDLVLLDSTQNTLPPFVLTYLCESACSTLTAKYRSCISNIETVLRSTLTNIEPQLNLVCKSKQLHPSYHINVFAILLFVSNKLLNCKLVGIAGINSSDGRVSDLRAVDLG